MAINKNKYSVCVIKRKNNKGRLIIVGYLSNRDIDNGLDISLDMQGYIIESL